MPERLRINGLDFDNLSRNDEINQTRLERGLHSNSIESGVKNKTKLYASVIGADHNRYMLEQMFLNPQNGISYVQGIRHSKYMLTGYRFRHSLIDLDFFEMDAVRFNDYGVKSDAMIIDIQNSSYVIDENFDDDSNWATLGAVSYKVSSSGGSLQDSQFDWITRNGTPSTSNTVTPLSGNQVLALDDTELISIVGTRNYTHYELSCYMYHSGTVPNAKGYIILDYYGYAGSVDKYIAVLLDFGNGTVSLYDTYLSQTVGTYDLPTGFTLTVGKWYYIKINIKNDTVAVHINSKYCGDVVHFNSFRGDIGFLSSYNTLYIDQVRVKVIPRIVSGVPNGGKADIRNFTDTVKTPYGDMDIVYDLDKFKFHRDTALDSVIDLDFDERHQLVIKDKTDNSNDALLRNSRWGTGYLNDAVVMEEGDLHIEDDSSLDDLDNFNLHLRFKIEDMDKVFRSSALNPIVAYGSKYSVYHVKRENTLVGHWTFNGNAKDTSGYERDGTEVGTVVYQEGKIQKGALLSGASNYISLDSNDQPFDVHRGISIASWVKLDSFPSESIVISKWQGTTASAWRMVIQDDGSQMRLHFSLYLSSGAYYFYGEYIDRITDWMHVSAVWDGERHVSFYLNGECVKVDYVNVDMTYTSFQSNSGPMAIGWSDSGTDYLDGMIEDLRIYNGVIDQSDIDFIYNNGNGTYKPLNWDRIGFEIHGELLMGEAIEEGKWYEFWFQSDGKTSEIYRRNLETHEVEAEARKVLKNALYFPLDGDLKSYSAIEMNLTNVNTTTSTETITAGSRHFDDASNQYLKGSTGGLMESFRGSFTISAWLNPDSIHSTDGNAFLSHPSRDGFLAMIKFNKFLRVLISSDGSSWMSDIVATGYSIEPNDWYHVVLQWDGYKQIGRLWLNGRMIHVSSAGSTQLYSGMGTTAVLHIGFYDYSRYYWDGYIDEVKIFNRFLTYDEIQRLYCVTRRENELFLHSTGYVTKSRNVGLVAHYKFNNNMLDESIFKRDLNSTSGATYTSGKIEQCLSLSSAAVVLPTSVRNSLIGGLDFSIAVWINSNNTPSVKEYILSHGVADNRLFLTLDTDSKIKAYTGDSSNFVTSTTAINAGTWYHILLIQKKKRLYLYINGTLESSSSADITFNNNETTFVLGAYDSSGTNAFDGKVDDLRFYNYILDVNERSFIYKEGKGSEVTHISKLYVDKFNQRNRTIYPHKYIESNLQVKVWHLPEDDVTNPDMFSSIQRGEYEEGESLYGLIDDVEVAEPLLKQTNSSYPNEWTTDTFSSKMNYSLILEDQRDWSFECGDFKDRYVGSKRYEITFSAWVKPKQIDVNNGLCYIWYEPASTTEIFYLYWYVYTGIVTFRASDGAGSYNLQNMYIDGYPLDTWYKFDFTFKKGVMSVYINGELVCTETYPVDHFFMKSEQVLVHDGFDSDYYVSMARIYDRALTAKEIKKNFVSEPDYAYYENEQILNRRQQVDTSDTLFLENGLFGMIIQPAGTTEAYKSTGHVKFKLWDDGWKKAGKLSFESQEDER